MDRDSMTLAKKGDWRAREQLVRAYYGDVMGYLVKVTLQPERAQALTRATFVRALRSLGSYREGMEPDRWLIAIAHHLYRAHCHTGRRGKPAPFDAPAEQGVDLQQAREAMEQLAALSPDRREMVVLRYYHGYSAREIGELMRLPERTVRARLHDALKRMAKGD